MWRYGKLSKQCTFTKRILQICTQGNHEQGFYLGFRGRRNLRGGQQDRGGAAGEGEDAAPDPGRAQGHRRRPEVQGRGGLLRQGQQGAGLPVLLERKCGERHQIFPNSSSQLRIQR